MILSLFSTSFELLASVVWKFEAKNNITIFQLMMLTVWFSLHQFLEFVIRVLPPLLHIPHLTKKIFLDDNVQRKRNIINNFVEQSVFCFGIWGVNLSIFSFFLAYSLESHLACRLHHNMLIAQRPRQTNKLAQGVYYI